MKQKKHISMRVYALLATGKRWNYVSAGKRIGITMLQYQRAIGLLRRQGFAIDTDLRLTRVGDTARMVATHQLIARQARR